MPCISVWRPKFNLQHTGQHSQKYMRPISFRNTDNVLKRIKYQSPFFTFCICIVDEIPSVTLRKSRQVKIQVCDHSTWVGWTSHLISTKSKSSNSETAEWGKIHSQSMGSTTKVENYTNNSKLDVTVSARYLMNERLKRSLRWWQRSDPVYRKQ